MDLIENRTIDEIEIGDQAEIERVLTQSGHHAVCHRVGGHHQAHAEPVVGRR
jgi:hypothetical protein